MTPLTWQIIFNCIQLLLTAAVWWSTRNKVTNARFVELENSKIKQDLEIEHLKEKLAKSKPKCDNHERMEGNDKQLFDKVNAVHGDIRELVGEIKRLSKSFDMIEQHLMDGGK